MCVEHNPELRKTKMTLCGGKYNTALLCNPNQDVRMTMQDECLLDNDRHKNIDIQIQRRSERQGKTPGFKDSNMNNFETFDQTNIRLKTEDGVGFWMRLTQQGVNSFTQNRLEFAEAAKQWTNLVNSYYFQGSLPWEIRWHKLGTTFRNLERQFWAGQHWILETRRIWWWINWKHYSEGNTEIRETFLRFRNEVVRIKKEKKRANVATMRRTKPIVASVLQYCSNRKIDILQTMDPTLHCKMMVTSRWWIWRKVGRLCMCTP